jgi:sulfur relay (sulfurtransferase) DsrF/TusC family protein
VKSVVVAVRSNPLTTGRVHEALRMALGMTLSNHRVTVAYMGEGAYAALALNGDRIQRPGLADSLELLDACHIGEVVEREALAPRHREALRARVQPVGRADLVTLIATSDVVIPW